MRNALLALTLLATTATIAHAEPDHYVETGAMAGANSELLTIAGTVEGGLHLSETPIWLRAGIATGVGGELFAAGHGEFLQLRAGAETRSCAWNGVLCGIVGVDLAYQHTAFTGHDTLSFGENVTRTDMSSTTAEMIAIPRIGLDVGGRVRFRPSLELDLGPNGADGANATLAVAYQW